jgi:hypothetical protein
VTLRRSTFIEPDPTPSSPSPDTETRRSAQRSRRLKARRYRAALVTTAAVAVGALAVGNLATAPLAAEAATLVTGDRIAADGFSRSQTDGFGSADSGGAYSSTTTSGLSVAGGAGVVTLASGEARNALLPKVTSADVETTVSIAVPQLPNAGNGVYTAVQLRSNGKSYYRATIRVLPNGKAALGIMRLNSAGAQTSLASEKVVVSGITAGSTVKLAFRAHGTTSVGLEARAWLAGAATPAWQQAATDSSPERITSGGVGLWAYLSGGTKALSVKFDDLTVNTLVGSSTPPTTTPTPTPTPTTPPTTTPTTPTTPATSTGNRGSAPVGSTKYPVPSGAIYVSSSAGSAGNGSSSSPYRSVTDAVNKAPNGATLVLRGGTYHESVTVPLGKKLTIQSYPGEAVWFDGSESVSNWSKTSNRWVASGFSTNFDSSPTFTKGLPDNSAESIKFVDPAYPMAAHPEQVWVGSTELTEVKSESLVTSGTFYVDDSGKRLVIGSDPTGKKVTASTLQKAIDVKGAGSTIRGIGVRKYATSVWQMGTITTQVENITLENLVVTDNATTGIYGWGSGLTMRNVTATLNGRSGGGATSADNLTIESSVFHDNNTEHFKRLPGSGGLKITRSRTVTIANSDFTNNLTTGLWLDESTYNATISGNRSIGNGGSGLVLEISDTMKVANNVLADNGRYGLWIGNTGNVQVWHNTIVGNEMAPLQFQMDKRRQTNLSLAGHDKRQSLPDMTVPWIIKNVTVSNNVFAATSGGCMVCVDDYTKALTAEDMKIALNGNLYHRASTSAPKTVVRWGQGTNAAKTFSTFADFASATGNDRNSVLANGSSVVNSDYTLSTFGLQQAGGVGLRAVPSWAGPLLGQAAAKAPLRVGANLPQ